VKTFGEFRSEHQNNADNCSDLQERLLTSMSIAASATLLATTGKSIKSTLNSVKQADNADKKLDLVSDAIGTVSTRITALSALVYASAKNIDNRKRRKR